MPYTKEEFVRETLEEFLKTLPLEKRLKLLSPEEIVKRLSPEDLIKLLCEGDLIKKLSPEQRTALRRQLQDTDSSSSPS